MLKENIIYQLKKTLLLESSVHAKAPLTLKPPELENLKICIDHFKPQPPAQALIAYTPNSVNLFNKTPTHHPYALPQSALPNVPNPQSLTPEWPTLLLSVTPPTTILPNMNSSDLK